MTAFADFSGADPRRALSADDLAQASLRAAPEVSRPSSGGDGLVMAGGVLAALGLGAVTLLTLSHERRPAPPPAPVVSVAPPAPPVTLPPLRLTATPAPVPPAPLPANQIDPAQSRANPMIVDNTSGGVVVATAPAPAGAGGQQPRATAVLTADEQFSARVAGDDAAAHASSLTNPAFAVMQGTIVPAVLETALNSDLPGYARAIVSRDVKSFDGSRVAIPRGSRLIGQYKSGLATGQSRAFIVWTRLIRPDGASIPLGSPVMDAAGETGLSGRVDRHFLQRFGSAALLSVVSGVTSALGNASSSTLVIGTGSEAQSAAAQALSVDGKIAPTIRVPQGTPIQVFTARDLDFSGT